MERKGHRYYAVDCSAKALAVARDNARRYGVEGDIIFLQGSWFEALQEDPNRGFDLIVSNPPYVPTRDFNTLALEISQYEPPQALDGGTDGLHAIELIIEKASAHMTPGGWLLLEIGQDQAASIRRLVAASGAYGDFSVTKDYSGLDRVIQARKKGPDGF
jgi:release factor glutamine methyltransferase